MTTIFTPMIMTINIIKNSYIMIKINDTYNGDKDNIQN